MLTAVDNGLRGRDFLAGAFSGADIMTGHACIVATRLGADVSDKPNVAAYVARLQARPALQRAWDT
jgi:glutathione S-transferase